ncbi:MAG: hypothetical protein AAF799_45560 [Myxococcota bacterium]
MNKNEKNTKSDDNIVGADTKVLDLEQLKEVLGGAAVPGAGGPLPTNPLGPIRLHTINANDTWQ